MNKLNLILICFNIKNKFMDFFLKILFVISIISVGLTFIKIFLFIFKIRLDYPLALPDRAVVFYPSIVYQVYWWFDKFQII